MLVSFLLLLSSSSTSVSNVTGVQKTFLLFLASLLLLAYLLAKVSAVAEDPVVTVALCRSIKNMLAYRTRTIGLVVFSAIELSKYQLSDHSLRKTIGLAIIELRNLTVGLSTIGTRKRTIHASLAFFCKI